MSVWVEVKVCFSGLPDPLPSKRQLLNLLSEHSVTNVVESYCDGVALNESFEVTETEILTGDDKLPVVIYIESKLEVQRVLALIEAHFSGRLVPSVRVLAESDLGNAWSEGAYFETDRFVIGPDSSDVLTDKFNILVSPGSAFGNGQHVSTLAMLRSLETLEFDSPKRVLDLGTGNGVLLIAASKLGSKELVGTDLSQDILDEAVLNFARNAVSADVILTTEVPVERGPFDLVLINIPIAGVRPLLPAIKQAISSDADIVFSGFTVSDGKIFSAELEKAGLTYVSEQQVRGWVSLRFKNSAV